MFINKIILMLSVLFFSIASYAETDNIQKDDDLENIMTTETIVLLKTNKGDITISLDHENAPLTSKNFIDYVEDGFYNGTIFHRVIDGFMIQGGGFELGMTQKNTNDPIKNEANNGLSNKMGTVAMARTMEPHSATAQFFINVSDNNFLDFTAENSQGWGYAVFGKVVEGIDVIEEIKSVETTFRAGHQDVPVEDIIIEKAIIVN